MAYTRAVTGVILMVALAVPVLARAQDRQRRDDSNGGGQRRERPERSENGQTRQGRERAVPRGEYSDRQRETARDSQRPSEAQRQYEAPRQYEAQRQYEAPRQYQGQREYHGQREYQAYEAPRQYQTPRRDEVRRYDDRRAVPRPSYSNRGGYGPRTIIVPRYIRPRIVTVIPYRPYVYRPRSSLGAYYGAEGSYPYGYTPRGYYDPVPGRIYGGLRITDAPREAQVFADGYYIGIVDDFDGIFQHANLEVGTHRIEIEAPGYGSVAFDVLVQPGRTITLRAEL